MAINYPQGYDDEFINIIKKIIDKLNSMGYTYDQAMQMAKDILEEAKQTNDMNTAVNERLDNIIADSGTSSTEVVDARGNYTILGGRIGDIEETGERAVDGLSHLASANANDNINLVNYLGDKQNIHPKVLYFENGWNGYKYWMGYTPYPFGNTEHENPCIAASNDRINWETPEGLTNPLDYAPDYEGYNSDTHLVYRPDTDTMELWWREVNLSNPDGTGTTRDIYRRTSTDGVNWTPEEMIISRTPTTDIMSPAAFYEAGEYTIYYVYNYTVYKETTINGDFSNMTAREEVAIQWGNLRPWHIDAIKNADGSVELLVSASHADTLRERDSLYHIMIESNGIIGKPRLILEPSESDNAIDNVKIYRSSILKEGDMYYIFYSSFGRGDYSFSNSTHMSIAWGHSLDSLNGYENRDLIKKPGSRIYEAGTNPVLENVDVTNIDAIEVTGDVTVVNFQRGYKGKRVTVFGRSGGPVNLTIVNSSRMQTPYIGEDVKISTTNGIAIDFVAIDKAGNFWRPIYQEFRKGVKRLTSPQVIDGLDVSDIDTLLLNSSGTTERYTVNSFSGGYPGKVLHVVADGTPYIDLIHSGKMRLPNGQDIELSLNRPGVTFVFTTSTGVRMITG